MDKVLTSKVSGTKSGISSRMTADWLGQTIASLAWMTSMAFYGLSSTGDWLQLLAASSWFFANMASLLKADDSNSGHQANT